MDKTAQPSAQAKATVGTQKLPPQEAVKSSLPAQPVQPTIAGKPAQGRKRSGIILISRTQLFLFVEGLSTVVVLPFATDVVRDLEIFNEVSFNEHLYTLFQKNAIPAANFSVIFGNLTIFARQILSTEISKKKAEEQSFLDTVPFDEISSQHVLMGSNTYLVAANKNFILGLTKALQAVGSDITLVLPEFLFSKDVNLSHGLTLESAAQLERKIPDYRKFNLLNKSVLPDESEQLQEQSKMKLQVKGGKSNRLFVLGGILFMLIGLLIVVYLWTQQQQENDKLKIPKQAVPIVTPVPSEPPASDAAALASPSAGVAESAVQGSVAPTILINYEPNVTAKADQLRQRLYQLGFRAIQLQSLQTETPRTHIIFSTTVSSKLQISMINEIQKLFGDVRSHVTKETSYDVIITLGSHNNEQNKIPY